MVDMRVDGLEEMPVVRGSLGRLAAVVLGAALLGGAAVVELLFPQSPASTVIAVVDAGYLGASLRLAVPIAFAGLGGIFAEKSGVINIGLEGLLIVSAFTGVLVVQRLAAGGTDSLLLGGVLAVGFAAALVAATWLVGGIAGGTRALGRALAAGAGGTALVVALAALLGGNRAVVWLGFVFAVLASTLLTLLFAVITIRYRADQIIAGLAVWLVALGLAPFASKVIWGTINSPSVPTLDQWNLVAVGASVPLVGPAVVGALDAAPDVVAALLGAIPIVGGGLAWLVRLIGGGLDLLTLVLLDAIPTVYMLLVAAPLSWYVLNRTAFGRWVRASGENPKALDTAGVDVTRVRYQAVLLSGVFAGIGGAGLALGQVGQFIGSGQTLVQGRGWIGITTYLFGNYNPLGTLAASFLFSALDALQIRVQQLTFLSLPPPLVRIAPFVTVIVVLALVGRTRIPDAAGEHYEPGED